MAFGGHRSLTSSAVTATWIPPSDDVVVGWAGAVPCNGVGWTHDESLEESSFES